MPIDRIVLKMIDHEEGQCWGSDKMDLLQIEVGVDNPIGVLVVSVMCWGEGLLFFMKR